MTLPWQCAGYLLPVHWKFRCFCSDWRCKWFLRPIHHPLPHSCAKSRPLLPQSALPALDYCHIFIAAHIVLGCDGLAMTLDEFHSFIGIEILGYKLYISRSSDGSMGIDICKGAPSFEGYISLGQNLSYYCAIGSKIYISLCLDIPVDLSPSLVKTKIFSSQQIPGKGVGVINCQVI